MCNTHLIRELTSAYENQSQDWALDMINLLSNIHKRVEQAKKQDESKPANTINGNIWIC
jgi:hypothetical protein